MKLAVLDTNTLGQGLDFSVLEPFGEVRYYGFTSQEEVVERIQDVTVVITNKVILDKSNLHLAKALKLICLTATGTNNVDLAYARSLGIHVCNIVGYSTESVVQHTFALLFRLMEKMAYYEQYVRSGAYIDDFDFKHYEVTFEELYGKTFGIIGLGRIGARVGAVAKAFGCEVHYYSTTQNNTNPNFKQVDFETLLATSHVVSIHAPLTHQTKHLMDYKALMQMQPSAILLNLGRGDILVESDLAQVLTAGHLGGVGLDVLSSEPMDKSGPLTALRNHEKLLITPHIGWASVASRNRAMQEVAKNIEAFVKGEKRCVVN